jgi:ribose/xylose/arabinose/galactoside ABC-type transport system permease subunit
MLSGSLFSISLGTTTAITAILFMALLHYGVVAAIVGTLLAGSAIFAIQGALVGLIGANPIIVTIGAGAIQEGIIGWLSPGDITPPPGASIEFLARTIFGLPFRSMCFSGSRLCLISACGKRGSALSSTAWARISRLRAPPDCPSRF